MAAGLATALVVIDMQEGMAERTRAGRQRANPQAEAHVAALLALFRARGLPVFHVLHDDPHPESPFRRDRPGGAPMDCARPQKGEPVFWKTGSSAFAGTGLDAALRKQGIGRIDAATVLRVTLSLLGADFARLVRAEEVAALV